MDIIIAPSEAKQLEATNRFCQDNEILAINALNVKDQSHVSNPYAFQLNIPANYMSALINEWYDSKFKGYKAIFIDAEKETKKDVSESLKKHLASQNIKYTTIVVDSYFGFDQVNDQINPGDKCVIIPTSGSKALLAKLAPILKTIKQDRIDVDLVLFGHPEYTTYLMEHQADLHKINTYIYSRFYYDSNDVTTKAIEEEYKKWYGEEMRYNVPRLGLFGYDTGMFFIKALCNNHQQFNDRIIDTHIGAQTTFKMERLSNWSGFTNKDLQFIHFTPQQTIEKLH
jgi:ABC-type branched-subunit amino acid transport system substrate-binding protein